MSPTSREPLAGGTLGKLAGRAKEAAGNLLGRRDLGREGRLQRVGAEAEDDAERRAAEADRIAQEADLADRRAANDAERREAETEAAEMAAADAIDDRAAAAEAEAERAEVNAELIDPKEET